MIPILSRKTLTMPGLWAILAAGLLAGCVQTATAPVPAAPPPAVPAVPAVPRAVVPPRPVMPPVAVPAVPAVPSGPLDSRSGLHQASVIAITGDADSRFTVMFRPAQTDAAKVEAAPAHLCRGAGRTVTDSRSNTPGAGSAMPGVQMMIVTCSAA